MFPLAKEERIIFRVSEKEKSEFFNRYKNKDRSRILRGLVQMLLAGDIKMVKYKEINQFTMKP